MTVGNVGCVGCLDNFAFLNKVSRVGFGLKVLARVGEFVQAHDVILFKGFIKSA
jgi:hypothetical protein